MSKMEQSKYWEKISLLPTKDKIAFFEKTLKREPIKNFSSIKPGDHLVIKRTIMGKEMYHHHFLCSNDRPMTIIHYYVTPKVQRKAAMESCNFRLSNVGTVQEVPIQELIENEMDLQMKGAEVERIRWPQEIKPYSDEEVIRRLRSALGEADYGLFHNNCESIAMWSICGLNFSPQSAALWVRIRF